MQGIGPLVQLWMGSTAMATYNTNLKFAYLFLDFLPTLLTMLTSLSTWLMTMISLVLLSYSFYSYLFMVFLNFLLYGHAMVRVFNHLESPLLNTLSTSYYITHRISMVVDIKYRSGRLVGKVIGWLVSNKRYVCVSCFGGNL